jgi:DNA gyrase subunit B
MIRSHDPEVLNKLEAEFVRTEGQVQIVIESRRNGARRRSVIDSSFLASGDFNRLRGHAKLFKDLKPPFGLSRDGHDGKDPLPTIEAAIWRLKDTASKGLTIGRYKGLGEMNAEQLWETTMDPSKRVTLRVQMAKTENENEIFETLMGDQVEPRREFIERNALDAARLDI